MKRNLYHSDERVENAVQRMRIGHRHGDAIDFIMMMGPKFRNLILTARSKEIPDSMSELAD